MWNANRKCIVRARSAQRKPASTGWDVEALMNISRRPQDILYGAIAAPTGWRESGREFGDRVAPEDEEPKTRKPSIQDFRITIKDLHEHVFAPIRCRKCSFIREHGDARRCGYAHSTVRRNRFKDIFGDTIEGRERLQRVAKRFARGAQEDNNSGIVPSGDATHEGLEASVPLHLRPRREGIDEDDDLPDLSPETPGDKDMDIERTLRGDADDMKDASSERSPSEPATKESKNEDAEMGFLEADTPAMRLPKLSEEERDEAVEAKSKRQWTEEAVRRMAENERICGVLPVRQLPDEGATIVIE